MATDATVQDFRRYDITSNKALRLAASCNGHYSSTDHVVSKIACNGPVGDGRIAVNGRVALLSPARVYDLRWLAQRVPIQPLVELARRMKKNVPADTVASGKLDAEITLRRDARSIGPAWDGGGAVVGLNARSLVNNTRLSVERIPFVVSSGSDFPSSSTSASSGPASTGPASARSARGQTRRAQLVVVPRVDVGPFNLGLGRPAAATVHGQFSHSGYSVVVQGDVDVQRLLDVARTAGLPAPQLAANGEARINLGVGGSWTGFAAPVVTGTAVLSSVHARLRGLNDPVEVASANLSLTPDATDVQKLTVVAAGNTWRGSLTMPRKCITPRTCPIRFDLRADEIVTAALAAASAGSAKQPWYRFLSSPAQSSPVQPASLPSSDKSRPYLASVHAVGRLSAGRLLIHNLVATRVSAGCRTGARPPAAKQSAWRGSGRAAYWRLDSGLHGKPSNV